MKNPKNHEEMTQYYRRMKNTPILERHKEIAVIEGCSFPYHPNPIASDAFVMLEDDTECECCGEKTRAIYDGAFFMAGYDIPQLCPKCIESGKAAKKYKGFFTPVTNRDYDTYNEEETYKIEACTPSYNFIQQEEWLSHCGEYCQYLGKLREEDITPELKEKVAETWDGPWDLAVVLSGLYYAYEAHLFYCKECKKYFLLADRD